MILKKPPEVIWLQYHGDSEPEDGPVAMADVTWASEKIFDSDIQYIRSDVANHRANELQAELSAFYALLSGYHYMDPPDGGDVSPLEQMRRMADDAASYRSGL